jgi:SAM-dependent methyltransferase
MIGIQPIRSYLDYGCGDGSITQCTGEVLGLCAKSIFGVDIHSNHIPGITYLQRSTSAIPSASIDLVTLFVTLHHLSPDDLDGCIAEIIRVLSPNGCLLIREHDFNGTNAMRAFLDLVHVFIDVADPPPADALTTYPINYRSNTYWTRLLFSKGFYLVKKSEYHGRNPHGLYYALYKLKK